MYFGPWKSLAGLVAHDWAPYSGETTLAEVAATMVETCGIRDGDSIIGTSLGGMVACEITRLRRIRQLFLVASALEPAELHPRLHALHPAGRFFSWKWLCWFTGRFPMKSPQMFSKNDPRFLRAMSRAIFQWAGLGTTKVPVIRIHGRFDPVIRCPDSPDFIIDGGHRINETHAEACVEFIRTRGMPR
jgi:pimeloyl-ACP methyl ester carboxylesterase